MAILGTLALRRARAVGDALGARPGEIVGAVGAVLLALVVVATTAPGQPWACVGAAYLGVCAWTDWLARKVYLPVSVAAIVLAFAARASGGRSELADGLVAALVLTALALLLALVTRGRGWGGGDVYAFAVVGASFGVRSGLAIVAVAFIAGAVLSLAALVLRRIDRATPLPMASFTYLGFVIVALTPSPPG